MLEADEGPLNVEHVVADNIGLAVFHQELKVVHGLLDTIIKNIANETEVDIRCKKKQKKQLRLQRYWLKYWLEFLLSWSSVKHAEWKSTAISETKYINRHWHKGI